MITFYLVRHGETLFNQLSLMQGWCDSPLTPKGKKQAQELALRLKEMTFSAAFSSTSERAMDTAQILLQYHPAITLTPRKEFKELNFGLFEGAQQYLVHNNPVYATFDFTSVDGENRQRLVKRFMEGLHTIAQQAHDDAHILIVSHGAAIMNVIKHINPEIAEAMKQDPHTPGIQNCSAHAITYTDGTFQVAAVNVDRMKASKCICKK